MDSSHSHEQDALTFGTEAFSLTFTLERGLHYVQQELYAEGLALLVMAREQLSPDQVFLAAALDAFIQGHTIYWQAQQALHHASQCFAETVTEQQARLATLHDLLAGLVEDKERKAQSHTGVVAQLLKDPQHYQAQRPPTDDQLLPALYITCFGHFEVRRSGKPVTLCSNRSGQSI